MLLDDITSVKNEDRALKRPWDPVLVHMGMSLMAVKGRATKEVESEWPWRRFRESAILKTKRTDGFHTQVVANSLRQKRHHWNKQNAASLSVSPNSSRHAYIHSHISEYNVHDSPLI